MQILLPDLPILDPTHENGAEMIACRLDIYAGATRVGSARLVAKGEHFRAQFDEELPERTLCAVRLRGLNLLEIASSADIGEHSGV